MGFVLGDGNKESAVNNITPDQKCNNNLNFDPHFIVNFIYPNYVSKMQLNESY